MSVFSQFNFKDFLVSAVIEQCAEQQRLGLSVPLLCFTFDDGNSVCLRFPSPEHLADFCKKHNFHLEDNRNEPKN